MMDFPLLLRTILYRAVLVYPDQEIVSREGQRTVRETYREVDGRARKLARALDGFGLSAGDRVASFGWNTHRHLELYFGVPCSGRVLHTVNIRLAPEQIVYTINHAQDQVLFVDPDLAPGIAKIAPQLTTVQAYVVLGEGETAQAAARLLPNAVLYEDLLAAQADGYVFPEFDERSAAILAYTSATTGNPKGVMYSHRGLYLHCMSCLAVKLAPTDEDVTMPIVPMFHVNAWGYPFLSTWVGARQVMPGPHPTPADLCRLITEQGVTVAAGVPTVWMAMLEELRAHPDVYDVSRVRLLLSGGSALPRALAEAYEKEFGIPLYQGYGQTETTPVTFLGATKATLADAPLEQRLDARAKAGLIMPGLELRLCDEAGHEVPYDGATSGELLLRGPWILKEYYKDAEATASAFVDGWFRTGDIATLDEQGYLQIVDRTKDIIKSGGEWISSVDLENQIMAHPAVREAAVIGVPDELWQERPIAIVVLRDPANQPLTEDELRSWLDGRVAHFWVPDRVLFIQEIPKTSVGKFSKKTLRKLVADGAI